jgi:hypothetical protein
MRFFSRSSAAAFATAALLLGLSACSGGNSGGMGSPVPQANPNVGAASSATSSVAKSSTTGSAASQFTAAVDTDINVDDNDFDDNGLSILRQLNDEVTIGSTVDPMNGDQNPYGLTVAPITAGKLIAGDLVICNFNNSNALGNVQGQGTTIVSLHPFPGSPTMHIAQNEALKGCNALALTQTDNIWAAAYVANDNPIVNPNGVLVTTLDQFHWNHPWGQTFSPHAGPFAEQAFYVAQAGNGSIVRVDINPNKPFTFDVIATGFAINHGAPGSILAPSGLQYDNVHDRLFIVDGANNTVYVLRHVSTIPPHGLSVDPNGKTFEGPFRRRARVVFSGPPLNGPISSALLPHDHLAIGNTLDPNGQNLIIEITAQGRLLFIKNVDKGAAGALFGMVATSTPDIDNTKLYFNDDNNNTLRVLEP